MINIIKTEYSFKQCYMHMHNVHKYVIDGRLAIADLDNTFGHIPFTKEAKKHKFHPIYGVRLRVSRPENKERRTGHLYTTFIAKDDAGLIALYQLVQKAYDNFYYFPRLWSEDVKNLHPGIICLGEGIYENYFPEPQDREVYEIIAGGSKRGDQFMFQFENRAGPMHIIPQDIDLSMCNAKIQKAQMIKWNTEFNIKNECVKGAKRRGIKMTEEYINRAEYELGLIVEKGYADYFMIVADMVKEAKRHMLVGPSRGSSAGSLVCYLMGITEVDPIKHNLIFERFIDINRFDLPDIDIDFPDKKREMVFNYLVAKYGRGNVRALGAVNSFMPKSAISACADALGIYPSEVAEVKDAIIERMSGDARAQMCVLDTFDHTEAGKAFIEKFPKMRIATKLEGHASHATRHAAGIIISNKPLHTYAGINSRDDVLMMDKKDAEFIDLLKVDCLGLRTLSIIEDTVAQIPHMSYQDVYDLPLDDEKALAIFNDMRLSGVFQFEGQALQIITNQMGVRCFDDIAAITSLARPGALNSGGTSRYIKYHSGSEPPKYFNDIHREITEETYGVTVYQEQMMEIARKIGRLSWADVCELRKAASKSLGDEFFSQYKDSFIEGAEATGLTAEESSAIWNDICHSGSWSFNKAHAVSYGLVSYWTAYFKANYPLEFAVASLNNARDDDHAIKLLRDMVKHEGMQYKAVVPEISGVHWEVHDGILIGGLTNIPGVGEKKAKDFIDMREGKKKPTPSFWNMMSDPSTPFDILFPTQHYFGKYFSDPISYGLSAAPVEIGSIASEQGKYIIIGRLMDRNLRDLNEYVFLKERNGELVTENNLYLNMIIEDDTGSIFCTINRWFFEQLGGQHIAETAKVGKSWYLIEGSITNEWRKLVVNRIKHLGDH